MEMIPKPTPKIPFWVDILFYLSIVLLIFTFISYFSLNHFLKTSQKTLTDLGTTLSEEVSEKATLKNELLAYQKKIKDFSGLINAHLKTSNIFTFMEEQCHPEVWFNSFSLDAEGGKVFLTGEAQNFEALGQQMLILKDEKLIKSIDLGGISPKEEGKINFNLSLSLDPSIFIFK